MFEEWAVPSKWAPQPTAGCWSEMGPAETQRWWYNPLGTADPSFFASLFVDLEIANELQYELRKMYSPSRYARVVSRIVNQPPRWCGTVVERVRFSETGSTLEASPCVFDTVPFTSLDSSGCVAIPLTTGSRGKGIASFACVFAPLAIGGPLLRLPLRCRLVKQSARERGLGQSCLTHARKIETAAKLLKLLYKLLFSPVWFAYESFLCTKRA